MTKAFKKVLSIGFAALLIATSLFVLFPVFNRSGATAKSSPTPITASADTATNPLSDATFEFKPGAAVYLPEEDEERVLDKMSFSLALKDPKWVKNCDSKGKKEKSTYSFTLHRVQLNGESEPLARVLLVRDGKYWLRLEQQLAYYDETFEFYTSPLPKMTTELTAKLQTKVNSLSKDLQKKGYKLTSWSYNDNSTTSDINWDPDEGNFFEEPYIRFCVDVNSTTTQYFVRFDYDIKYFHKTKNAGWWWEEDVYKHKKGTIDSSVRSVYEILKNASEEPAPEEGFKSALEWEIIDEDLIEEAYKILGYANKQIVNIQWLQQIGNTPFATPVKKKVTIILTDNVLKTDQVASVLNISNFDVIGTTCKEFLYDETTDTYVAQYYKSVYLTSRTADGNTTNPSEQSSAKYFLDINLSYHDYYYRLVEDKVFSEELYEYVYYTNIITNYPELHSYKPKEVYGYFGYVVIPDTYTLNSLWKSLFDTETSFDGVTVNFCYKDNLSYDSYMKLLDEYGYNWAAQAWNATAGFVAGKSYPANHYLFLADVTSEKKNDIHISENGASDVMDDDGVIFNETEKAVEELGKVIEETLDSVGDTISKTASETKRTFQVIFGIVAGGLLIVFGAWVYRKVVPTKTTSRRRKKK